LALVWAYIDAMRQRGFLIAVLVLLSPVTGHAAYRDLCTSVSAACDWSGPDAPRLSIDVCWSSSTGVKVKGTAPCPLGQKPYYAAYGEVIDPSAGSVQAYAPLDWACDTAGLCLAGPPPDGATEMAICCEFGVCVDLAIVPCNSNNSIAMMCTSGVSNQDGTIDCYEGEEF
jgi:hypothetical protein